MYSMYRGHLKKLVNMRVLSLEKRQILHYKTTDSPLATTSCPLVTTDFPLSTTDFPLC